MFQIVVDITLVGSLCVVNVFHVQKRLKYRAISYRIFFISVDKRDAE